MRSELIACSIQYICRTTQYGTYSHLPSTAHRSLYRMRFYLCLLQVLGSHTVMRDVHLLFRCLLANDCHFLRKNTVMREGVPKISPFVVAVCTCTRICLFPQLMLGEVPLLHMPVEVGGGQGVQRILSCCCCRGAYLSRYILGG